MRYFRGLLCFGIPLSVLLYAIGYVVIRAFVHYHH